MKKVEKRTKPQGNETTQPARYGCQDTYSLMQDTDLLRFVEVPLDNSPDRSHSTSSSDYHSSDKSQNWNLPIPFEDFSDTAQSDDDYSLIEEEEKEEKGEEKEIFESDQQDILQKLTLLRQDPRAKKYLDDEKQQTLNKIFLTYPNIENNTRTLSKQIFQSLINLIKVKQFLENPDSRNKKLRKKTDFRN